MTAPVAARVTSQIDDQIREMLIMLSRHLDTSDQRFVGWLDDLQRAMPAGRKEAFLSMASVYHLVGDLKTSLAMVERAKTNGADDTTAAACLLPIYLNLGYASRAAEVGLASTSVRLGTLTVGLPQIIMSGSFGLARQLMEQAAMANLDLSGVSQIEEIREIAKASASLGTKDEEFSRVLDIAGAVLRERKLFWIEESPRFYYDHEMEVVAMRYLVDVTPDEAARLTTQISDGIVEAGLERVPLSVAFVGVAEEVEV